MKCEDTPVPDPNSNSCPPGFDAANILGNDPVSVSDAISKPMDLVSLVIDSNTSGIRFVNSCFNYNLYSISILSIGLQSLK